MGKYKGTHTKTAEDMEKVETPYIDAMYHLAWANRACKWKLVKFIDNNKCEMIAVVSNKKLIADIKDLRHYK